MNGRGKVAALCALVISACSAGELKPEDPITTVAPISPNWALAAPPGVETKTQPTHVSAASPLTASELFARADAAIRSEERMSVVGGDDAALMRAYVQRSRILGFPDLLTLRVIDLGDGESGVALYSRSIYGYGDLGVNAARVTRLLEKIAP